MFDNFKKNNSKIKTQLNDFIANNPVQHFEVFSIKYIKYIGYVFAFLICAYVMIWLVVARKISWTIIHQIDFMRDKKINISFDDYSNFGFPISFSTLLKNVKYQNNNQSFIWKTKEVYLKSPLSNSRKIIIDFPQKQFFLTTDSATVKSKRYYHKTGLDSEMCQAKLLYQNGKLDTIRLKSSNGLIDFLDSKQKYQYHTFNFYAKESKIIIDDVIEKLVEINIDFQKIQPPKLWQGILEYDFSALNATVYMRNPSNFSKISNFNKFVMRGYDPPEFIIDNAILKHPLSDFQLKGLISLDRNMQLNGNLIVTITDYQKLIQFLTKKGVLSEKVASNFRFMLSFLTATRTLVKNDGTIDIDLTIKNNFVYQGKVRLFEL